MSTATASKRRDVGYIDHPNFAQPGIEAELFGQPLPALPPAIQLEPDFRRAMPDVAPLSREEERLCFLQFNYARRRVIAGEGGVVPLWSERATYLREYLVRKNLGLVSATLNRCAGRLSNAVEADDAFSAGMTALLHAVERFDVSRGWKFSSFAFRCILNAVAVEALKASKRAARVQTVELTNVTEGHARHDGIGYAETCDDVAVLRQALDGNAAGLTPKERAVIEGRFFDNPKATYHELGHQIGVSKERARQIEHGALAKLRAVLAPSLGTAAD